MNRESGKIKSLKGTTTEKNVLLSFAGESQARNRYTYFTSHAKKDGCEQIAAIFLDTADNEKEPAKVFFKLLEGGEPLEITEGEGCLFSPLGRDAQSAEGSLKAVYFA